MMQSTSPPTTTKVGLKYGLYTGLASILYLALTYTLRLENDSLVSILGTVIAVVGVVYGIREYKKLNEDYISTGQGFGLGMVVSAISGVLSAIFYLLYLKFINIALANEMRQQILNLYEKQKMREQDMEIIEKMLKYLPEFFFAGSILGSLIFGLLVSLVVASIMAKPRPPFE
ncbi:MAG: DUF4199 domain-containing protein [Microscillaceae bacterium]|nr:DUF4199 domain-containing protein [Microscillaceae bacterium]